MKSIRKEYISGDVVGLVVKAVSRGVFGGDLFAGNLMREVSILTSGKSCDEC